MPFSQGQSTQSGRRRGGTRLGLHVAGPEGFSPSLRLGARSPVVGKHALLRAQATDSDSPAFTIERNEALTLTYYNMDEPCKHQKAT